MNDDNSIIQPTKTCSTCKQSKLLSCFSKKKRLKDGLNCQCKACQSEYYKRFYNNNREEQCERSRRFKEENPPTAEEHDEIKRKKRDWWAANREDIAQRRRERYWDEASGIRQRNIERCSKWVSDNGEAVCEKMRLYYRKNADKIKARVRQYEKENPEKTKILGRVKANRRRARLSTSSKHYTRHDVARIYEAQRRKCANCGTSISGGYHIDHKVPVAKGGDNSPGNIELLCPKCNYAKGAKMPHDFAKENGRLL